MEKKASKEELIKLMDAKNPILRVVAYRAIVNRNEPEYFDLLTNHLSDTAKVTSWFYEDASDSFFVSDLMIRKAFDKRGLSPIQKKVLTEKVLLEHSYLDVSNWMIQDVDPNEKYYNLIKKRAQTKNEKCDQLTACYALSKFKKKEDVTFLFNVFKQNINGGCKERVFKSIEKFPDPKFFQLLNVYFQNNIKGKLTPKENISDEVLYFARAIAVYKNSESLAILNYIAENNTYINKPYWPPSNKEYVFQAAKIYYDTIYNNLIKKIEKEIDPCELKTLSYRWMDDFRNENKDW
ncbi:hypothetical protein J3D55_004202 [Chryseobacterium ginsenosidimutans]|uniref:hypothetical protein n=1 Tax=Chryseobacterium ginsenosidimutans TaxID=687846 RepID=UPI002166D11D|nr:hypothetical protein [Chryseobacterium ginsenosidimutans]MCS3871286.1 hypothetical protein [Chryseobacterium ginsenosidimutans]